MCINKNKEITNQQNIRSEHITLDVCGETLLGKIQHQIEHKSTLILKPIVHYQHTSLVNLIAFW